MNARLLLFFYNLIGFFILLGMAVPVLAVRRWREGLSERLAMATPRCRGEEREECFWVHGASVGEILAAAGLVEGLLDRYPAARLIITTYTASGRKIARDRYSSFGERVEFAILPLDWDGLPAKALKQRRPDLFVILETELWPNLLYSLGKMGCPLIMVNGRLSEKSLPRYRMLKILFRPFLRSFTRVCVRTQVDADRFHQIGIGKERITITGNVKHDRKPDRPLTEKAAFLMRRLEEERGDVGVAGSLRGLEVKIVLDAYKALKKSLPQHLVMAPRHPERFDCKELAGLSDPWMRWSEMGSRWDGKVPSVILVDTVGELAELYRLAAVSFVGGTFGRWGGHNLLEPAFFSVPVLFGPGFESFREEGEALVAVGGGEVIEGVDDFVRKAAALLEDRSLRDEKGRRAGKVAGQFSGSVEKNLAVITGVLGR